MDDFNQAHNINLKEYISSNFSGELKKLNNNDYRLNPCPIPNCKHEDCFTIYNNDAKFHCFSCGAKGDIIDLLVKTGKAKDVREALEQLGIESEFVSKARDTFQGTTTGVKLAEPVKHEGKALISRESSLKSKSLTERIREQIANSKKENNSSSLSESTKTVEPVKEKAIDKQLPSSLSEVLEDPFKVDPVKEEDKKVVTLESTQQLTEGDYFQSRGLSNEVIERYGLKVEQGFALLPGGIRRNLIEKQYMNPAGKEVSLFNIDYLQKSKDIIL